MGDPAIGDPADLGELTVHDRVIETVTERVVLDTSGVIRSSSAIDRITGREFPRITVVTAGKRTRITVHAAVAWPNPAHTVCQAIHDRILSEVPHLTGLPVDRVDVTAHYVVDTAPPRRRILQGENDDHSRT
ncbi:Asp23/Gls24 family envelope stress response protein [Hoyosella rhizosphaerae]|uniref:Asp23/Gls24 family envelope stress response protein n=1 Tax=Hoyosella rhizosphaerae TaxID=1755582 RepID=A0A916UKN4_9ACTN|nr:Asp23/Gls24 family envelope stress response protein [Hoyosella rhizosphaerae]MBN4925439.1 Asp23/Gls24 family envelope stress response protein [Hoyosella rhizosphaerae]GGC75190.1 hypothetical protein GCM10011410_30620 [Hoyosella rhizosphaerae]